MLELTLGLLCLASYPDAYMYPKENTAICLGNCESCHDYVERHPEYLNHCDVSPVRIGAFLSSPHICRLGPELVAFSLDFHVFGLSTFAGGRKHVVESGLPLAEKIVEFVETACTTMQNHSIKLFRAGLTFLASDASPTRGQLKNVSFAPPHLGDVDESGGRLLDIYDLHLSEARRGSSSPCGNHSTEYDEFVAEALHVSRVARLFMDHARTALRRNERPLRVLEIGVACGQNGGHLLRNVPEALYIGIDPTILPEVRSRLGVFSPRVKLWANRSEDVVDLISDQSIDLLFVDGPHTYKQVRQDILNYQHKVKPGGIMAGHDFTCAHPPLLWAVSEQFLGHTLELSVDGVWWTWI